MHRKVASAPTARTRAGDVLANDPVGLKILRTTAPKHGTLSVVGNLVEYQPNKGFIGPDRFVYETEDRDGHTSLGQVQLDVAPPCVPVKRLN